MDQANPLNYYQVALVKKYDIFDKIGEGANAVVLRARDKQQRTVALKIIHSHLIHDKENLERFEREAKVSKSLDHKNIVKVYDFGSENNVYYMALEFLEGIDLFKKIKTKGILSIDEALKYIIPIASSLDYAHANKIIHRDVKSANIIITKDRPILTDFGIARISSGTQLTQTGTIMGTVEYMSPEQADGGKLDNRSDLYSLGVVLYECLTGTVPFKSDNMVITLSKIIKDPLIQAKSRNNSIPDWLNSVINKILDKNKNNRFNSGAEFAAALHDRKIIVQSPATVKFDPRRTREQITPDKPQVRTPTAERSRSAAKKNGKISSDRIIIAAAGVLIVFLIAFILLRNANTSGNNNSTDEVRTERIIENGTQAVPLNQSERSEEKEIPKPEQKKEKPVPEKPKPEKQKERTESVAKTSIPNVIGRQLSVAQAVINAKGLSIGSINYIDDPEKKGIVLRQIPPSGIDVKPGSPINLTIGK